MFFFVFFRKMSLFPFWKGLRSQVRAVSFAEENSCVVSPFTVKESDADVNFWRVNVKVEMQEYVLLPWLHVWTQRMKTPHSHIQQYTNIHGPRACKYLTNLQMCSLLQPWGHWLSLLCASRYITACKNYNIMFISSRKVHTLKSEHNKKKNRLKKSEMRAQKKQTKQWLNIKPGNPLFCHFPNKKRIQTKKNAEKKFSRETCVDFRLLGFLWYV